jgi:hypothetical protein
MSLLNNSIEALRSRFYTVEEFPFIDRSRLPEGIIKTALSIKPNEWDTFAVALTGKELEALLRDYVFLTDPQDQLKAAGILTRCMSARMIKLVIALYQDQFEASSLNLLLQKLKDEAQKQEKLPDVGIFIWRFGDLDDKSEAYREEIELDQKSIDGFFARFRLTTTSRLSIEIRLQYLIAADQAGLLSNQRHLVYLIEQLPAPALIGLISHYLGQLSMVDYLDGVNLAILDKLGEPLQSEEWEPYDDELCTSFAQWNFLHMLKLRSIRFPKKYMVLSNYYDRIRSCYELEDSKVMIIDFGEIIVADIGDKPYSYFYYRKSFEEEMDRFEKEGVEPSFAQMDKELISARDYIIEDREGSCMQLSYEDMGTLYIRELMDITMGLEPNFRQKARKSKKR